MSCPPPCETLLACPVMSSSALFSHHMLLWGMLGCGDSSLHVRNGDGCGCCWVECMYWVPMPCGRTSRTPACPFRICPVSCVYKSHNTYLIPANNVVHWVMKDVMIVKSRYETKQPSSSIVSGTTGGNYGHIYDCLRCNTNILFSICRIRSAVVPVGLATRRTLCALPRNGRKYYRARSHVLVQRSRVRMRTRLRRSCWRLQHTIGHLKQILDD